MLNEYDVFAILVICITAMAITALVTVK